MNDYSGKSCELLNSIYDELSWAVHLNLFLNMSFNPWIPGPMYKFLLSFSCHEITTSIENVRSRSFLDGTIVNAPRSELKD